MKKLILTAIIFSLLNCAFAQQKDTTSTPNGMFFLKGNGGVLTPFSNSNPAVNKSDNYTFGFSFGVILGSKKSKAFMGMEIGGFKGKLPNNDKTLGLNDNYDLSGGLYKLLFQYNFCKWFNIQYNLGMGSIQCERPWFVLPSNLSANGKQIVEYPVKIINSCFVTGIGVNINPLKWLSINANCDYIGCTFNFENVVHTEDNYVTKFYNPDFKLRAYYTSIGIIIHSPY